jgi:hypothetical protein
MISPEKRTAPTKNVKNARRFLEEHAPNPVPRNAKPATGSHDKPALLNDRKELCEATIESALMVRVALALPLPSNVTEFELSEQVGPPACAES